MPQYVSTSFKRERVILDGNSFRQCTFTECELVYAARGKVTLDTCVFDQCSYTFDGPAQDTLLFLTGLYMIDPGAIEATFQNIRAGAQPIKLV